MPGVAQVIPTVYFYVWSEIIFEVPGVARGILTILHNFYTVYVTPKVPSLIGSLKKTQPIWFSRLANGEHINEGRDLYTVVSDYITTMKTTFLFKLFF